MDDSDPSAALGAPTVAASAYECLESIQSCLFRADAVHPRELSMVENQLARFSSWAASIGVFAPGAASMDHRLRYTPEVQNIVTGLLESLNYRVRIYSDSLAIIADSATSDPARISEKRLEGCFLEIAAEITRLNKISNTIRRASKEAQLLKASDFQIKDDEGENVEPLLLRIFEHYIADRFPCVSDAIRSRLVRSMLLRRKQIMYRRYRAGNTYSQSIGIISPVPIKLPGAQSTAEPLAAEKSNQHDKKRPASRETASQVKSATTLVAENYKMTSAAPSKVSVSRTIASGKHQALVYPSAPGFAAKRAYEQFKSQQTEEAAKTNTESGLQDLLASHLQKIGEITCPYCLNALPAAEVFDTRKWQNHVRGDLEPYVCLFEDCNQPDVLYTRSEAWLDHLHQHKKVWHCSLRCEIGPFSELEEYMGHMRQVHNTKLNDRQLRAIANRNSRRTGALFLSCPLCGREESEVESRLEDHLAGHLRSLALKSLPSYQDAIPDDAASVHTSINGSQPRSRSTIKDSFEGIMQPSQSDADLAVEERSEPLQLESLELNFMGEAYKLLDIGDESVSSANTFDSMIFKVGSANLEKDPILQSILEKQSRRADVNHDPPDNIEELQWQHSAMDEPKSSTTQPSRQEDADSGAISTINVEEAESGVAGSSENNQALGEASSLPSDDIVYTGNQPVDQRDPPINVDGNATHVPVSTKHPRVVSPPQNKQVDKPLRGILKQPRTKFPEEANPIREGVAPHKEDKKLKEVPPGARWTKINQSVVSPEALTLGKERFEERDGFVIVLRVLSKEEIEAYAAATQVLQERRHRVRNEDMILNDIQSYGSSRTISQATKSPEEPITGSTLLKRDQAPLRASEEITFDNFRFKDIDPLALEHDAPSQNNLAGQERSFSDYGAEEFSDAAAHNIIRRPSRQVRDDDDRRRMPPPRVIHQRPRSASPQKTEALRPPVSVRPRHQTAPRASYRQSANYMGVYDYEYDPSHELSTDLSSEPVHPQRRYVQPVRSGRGSEAYEEVDIIPAGRRNRRPTMYGSNIQPIDSEAQDADSKIRDAQSYQDAVSGGPMPLTAEMLRKATRGNPGSQSTRSSGSRDDSEFRRSYTTGNTRSSSGSGEEDYATIKIGGATLRVPRGAEVTVSQGQAQIRSTAVSTDTVYRGEDGKSSTPRPYRPTSDKSSTNYPITDDGPSSTQEQARSGEEGEQQTDSINTATSPWQARLEEVCREAQIMFPIFQMVSDKRGSRTSWKSRVTIQGQTLSARHWHGGRDQKNAKISAREDVAELAVAWLTSNSFRPTASPSGGWSELDYYNAAPSRVPKSEGEDALPEQIPLGDDSVLSTHSIENQMDLDPSIKNPFSPGVDGHHMANGVTAGYQVEYSGRFRPGQIFKILWPEPRGAVRDTSESSSTGVATAADRYGNPIYVSIRRFIIISSETGHCTCLPIVTYGRRGTNKAGVQPAEHGAVYERGTTYAKIAGERGLGYRPVRVEMTAEGEVLPNEARINYAKMVTVEFNVKVFFVGHVSEDDWPIVEDAVDDCWNKKMRRRRANRQTE